MATQASIEREKKRTKLSDQYRSKREALKNQLQQYFAMLEQGGASAANEEEIYAAIVALQAKLDALPRNSSPKRRRRRCQLTGRPRGVYRKFELCRNKIRELAMMGLFPGVEKSSW